MRGPPLRDRRPSSKRRFELGGASGERPDSFSDDLSVDPSFSTGLAALLPARFLIASSSWAISATVESDALEATPPGRVGAGGSTSAATGLQKGDRQGTRRPARHPRMYQAFHLVHPEAPRFPPVGRGRKQNERAKPTPSVFLPYEDWPSNQSSGQDDGCLEGWLRTTFVRLNPGGKRRLSDSVWTLYTKLTSFRFQFPVGRQVWVEHLVNRRGDGWNCGNDGARGLSSRR